MNKLGYLLGALCIAALLCMPVMADEMTASGGVAGAITFSMLQTEQNFGMMVVGTNTKTVADAISISTNVPYQISVVDPFPVLPSGPRPTGYRGKMVRVIGTGTYDPVKPGISTPLQVAVNGGSFIDVPSDTTPAVLRTGSPEIATLPLNLKQTVTITDPLSNNVRGGPATNSIYDIHLQVTASAT